MTTLRGGWSARAGARHSYLLLAIVLVGIGIRVTYTVTTGHHRGVTSRQGQIAHNILAYGRWFERNETAEAYVVALTARRNQLIDPASVDYASVGKPARWLPETTQSIGVSAVMAGLWSISGDQRYVQLEILQGILDGFVALLVYHIAMRLFRRRRAATIAAALYAIYPPLAWQTADAYNDIWAVDFTIVLTAIYLAAMASPKPWRWLVLCGICAGVGAYFRPQVLLVPAFLAVASVTVTGRREALRRIVVTGLVASLLLVPWTIRNYEDFHAFVPIRSVLWQTMWAGFTELPNNFGEDFSEQRLDATISRARPDLVSETPAWDSYIKHYVVHIIEHHPLFYAEILAHRVLASTVLIFDPAWMHRGATGAFSYSGGLLAFIREQPFDVLQDALEPLVFLSAMLGLWLTWRRWKAQHKLLVALVLCVLLPYIALHVEARFLLPAAFVYFIWIGLGMDQLLAHGPRRARAVSTLGACAILGGATRKRKRFSRTLAKTSQAGRI